MIDTYAPGTPDAYPLFLDRRVYQGSSGRIYPMPMIDSIAHDKVPQQWQAIHLENAYVRLLLLPEIGGRIHVGYDKVAGYDFFYRNNVIKPALVGLAGPWISGGVEFNWPQHHRPATFLPVDVRIEREADGAVAVWHSDLDPLQRMRGTHGVRLRPGSSVIEADVRLHNRTDVAQTFLWWANVAAAAHEDSQSFFPDDVAYVADHARRAMTAFPQADRPYYGVDYPALAQSRPGADRIDRYTNIPVPTSYMITDTRDAFFGGYDHAVDAGFMHWADPALSPGKKQWTWGTGEIGRAWDAQLTDTDGPYVELMAGVYTDNQPDFAWLAPGETKRFSQFWYPIHRMGPARQATVDAAVSVDGDRIGVIATRPLGAAELVVATADGRSAGWTGTLGPDAPLQIDLAEIGLDAASEPVEVTLHDRTGTDAEGAVLVRWVRRDEVADEPWVATAPPPPAEIAATDELYATATHLEQYRHPTRSAAPYLRAALDRDPGDVRAATALALLQLRRGEYGAAGDLLETALARLTRRNLNPREGETQYVLGLVRERQGDQASADRHFARAAWSAAWTAPADLARARLALRGGRPADALRLAASADAIPEARRVGVLALHRLGRLDEAAQRLRALAQAEPLDAVTGALAAALGIDDVVAVVTSVDPRTTLEAGVEFARAGEYALALQATASTRTDAARAFGNVEPMRHILRAHWARLRGDEAAAAAELTGLAHDPLELAFPAGLDQYDALAAMAADAGAPAQALLGMWLLDAGRDDDALRALRAATDAGLADQVAWRNLALAIVRTGGSHTDADAAYERALALRTDPRLIFERDVLARIAGASPAARLALLEQTPGALAARDDLALAHVVLLLEADRTDDAWSVLTERTFRPFEGGEGQVIAAYDRAATVLARRLLVNGCPDEAIALLEPGLVAPSNLGEGRHPADPQAERLVVLGDALAALGDEAGARARWEHARAASPLAVAERPAEVADVWVAVAHERLGEASQAHAVRARLRDRADELDRAGDEVDYFATSLPELLVFDVDTAAARRDQAARLRAAAEAVDA